MLVCVGVGLNYESRLKKSDVPTRRETLTKNILRESVYYYNVVGGFEGIVMDICSYGG